MAQLAVFLDRDGTINVEKDHLYKFRDWEWLPGAIEAIRCFNSLGLLVIVVNNQAGIARGLYDEDAVLNLHKIIDAELARKRVRIDAYYFCPHHPEYGPERDCSCRKPKPGLLLRAAQEFKIDLHGSFMIGDKASDIEAAAAAGVQPILVATGYGREHCRQVGPEIPYFEDISAAADFIRQKILSGGLNRTHHA